MLQISSTLRLGVTFIAIFLSTCSAQTMDGTAVGDEAVYGSPLSIQNTDSGFGDSVSGLPFEAIGGSEIDQVFGAVVDKRLHMLITGNLESNFNKLEIFFDTKSNLGINQIVGTELPRGVDPFCCGGIGTLNGALQEMSGLRFDSAIEADYYLTISNGYESIGGTDFLAASAHFADLTRGSEGVTGSLGIQMEAMGRERIDILTGLPQGTLIDQHNNGWDGPDDPNGTPIEHEFVEPVSPTDPTNDLNHRDMSNFLNLEMAIDNSNQFGVNAGASAPWDTLGDPEFVETGIEFSVPLSALGNPDGDIKVVAFINGIIHDFVSNQFAGEGVMRGNLGGLFSAINLANIPGDQFVTVPYNPPIVDVDFDANGSVDCADINALVAEIANGSDEAQFDITGDGSVDAADLDLWRSVAAIQNGLGSSYRNGDYNLDGVVDVGDFNIWNKNKFTIVSAWCSGDGNADGSVDVGDFNLWNKNKFTSSDTGSVPEPAGSAMIWVAVIIAMITRRPPFMSRYSISAA